MGVRRWSLVLCVAFVAAAFGVGEAEGADAAQQGEKLGEATTMGGADLSKLAFLMNPTNEANLKTLLTNIGDAQTATSLASLSKNAPALQKLADPGVVAKLIAEAAKAKGKAGKDGISGINGQPGAPGPKGDQGDRGDKGRPGIAGETGLKGTDGKTGEQ